MKRKLIPIANLPQLAVFQRKMMPRFFITFGESGERELFAQLAFDSAHAVRLRADEIWLMWQILNGGFQSWLIENAPNLNPVN